MALLLPVEDKFPQMGANCFIAPNATLVGDVIMGQDCSVWFNAVVRGDVNFIRIGNKVNIQDGACIHCTFQKYGTNDWQQCIHWTPCDCTWMHPCR